MRSGLTAASCIWRDEPMSGTIADRDGGRPAVLNRHARSDRRVPAHSIRATSMRWCPWRMSLLLVTFALALIAEPRPLRAQLSSTALASSWSCLKSIPNDSMAQVVVYVAVDTVGTVTDRRIGKAIGNVDVVAQAVAEQISTMLGAKGDTLPSGSPEINWRDLYSSLVVTAQRDGRMVSRPERDSLDTKGSALLSRALAAALAAGAGFVWPDSTLDSLMFRLRLVTPVVRRLRYAEPPRDPIQIPAFTLAVPWEEPVLVRTSVPPKYPWRTEEAQATARVFLDFVVDTLGHADSTTIRDIWYSSHPRLTGRLGEFYAEFVKAARTALVRWTFFPARVGGCRVAQQVEQEFIYKEPTAKSSDGMTVRYVPQS